MVMFNRSLRAVFRKESWMFCAGLLLSIADLLKFFDLRIPTCPFRRRLRASSNRQHVPSRTSHERARGDNLPPRRLVFPKAAPPSGSCEEHTASPSAFQPRSSEKGLRLFYSVQ